MAFISPTVKKLSDSCFLVRGTIPASSGSGTIGFVGRTASPAADVLIDANDWDPYKFEGENVSLAELVKVTPVTTGLQVGISPVGIAKTGTTKSNFLITANNNNNTGTVAVDLYIELPGR